MPVISLKSEEEKSPDKKSGGLGISIAMVVLAVLLVGVAWGGAYYYKYYEQQRIDKLEAEAAALQTELAKYDEIKTKNKVLRAQIKNVTNLLENQNCFSKIFDELEAMTVKKLYFTNFNADAAIGSGKVSLRGRTDSYVTLADQLAVFRNSDWIDYYNISQAKMISEGDKNYLEFDTDLYLREGSLLCENESQEENK